MNGRRGETAYSGSWLAVRLGLEPRELDARRRAGDLLAVRTDNGRDYLYPAWQLDDEGRPLESVGRVVRAARTAGLTDDALYALLHRRDGMTGRGRLLDSLREGREGRVVDAIRAAAARR